jgi:hypothetical protein
MNPRLERNLFNFFVLFVGLLIVTLPLYIIIVFLTDYIFANIFLFMMIVSFILTQIYFIYFHEYTQIDQTIIVYLVLISITIPIWNIISIIIYYIDYFDMENQNLYLFSYLTPLVIFIIFMFIRSLIPERKMRIWDDKIKGYREINLKNN